MEQILVDSQSIAEEFYSLLHALDRAGQRQQARNRETWQRLAERVRHALHRASPARPHHAAILGRLRDVSQIVGEVPPAAAPVHDWAAFRRRADLAYESLAASLRGLKIRMPSLRPKNYARNLFHIGSGLCALGVVELLPGRGLLIALAAGFCLFAWTMEIGRRQSERWHRFAIRMFRPVIHPHEHHRVNSATWYATALFLLSLAAPKPVCALAVTVLAFADPAAAIVGRRFGRVRVRAGRSLEGTTAFLAVGLLAAFAALLAFHPALGAGRSLALALAAASSGALAELYSGPLDDNFTIPTIVGAACWPLLTLLG